MLRWFRSHGEVVRVGVERTESCGAGLTRHLAPAGAPALEVTGPEPSQRRSQGKDDRLDAIAAARAALESRRHACGPLPSPVLDTLPTVVVRSTGSMKNLGAGRVLG
jgi:hypothetical protein